MSLINRMLQDLESRQGGAVKDNALPAGVAASAPEQPKRLRLRGVALLVLLGAAAGAGYFVRMSPAEPPMPSPLLSTIDVLPPARVIPLPEEPVVPAPLEAAPSVAEPVAAAPAIPAAAPVTSAPPPVATKPAARPAKKAPVTEKRPMSRAQPAIHTASARQAVAEQAERTPVMARKSPDGEAQERAEKLFQNSLNAYAQGRTTESLAQVRQALGEYAGHLGARQLLLRQLVEQGANDQARGILRDGLLIHPAQISWISLLARLELERGDMPAARQVIDRAMPLAGGNADFLSLAAAIAMRQGKSGEAAEFYRNALRQKSSEGRNWVGLGLALEAEGNSTEAKEAFRRALGTENLTPELRELAQRKQR